MASGAYQFGTGRGGHIVKNAYLGEGEDMTEGVYKIIELIGTSPNSWEEAASNAVAAASESLEDLRVAEVVELDLKLDSTTNKVLAYRAKVRVSFRYHQD
jgi:dodecin